MDSWTPAQLQLMKMGGNKKCQSYLSSKGILPGTPIKQKYESDQAQLYKFILKARAEGEFCCCVVFSFWAKPCCAVHIMYSVRGAFSPQTQFSIFVGKPEPTELPKKAPSSGNNRPMGSIHSMGGGMQGMGGGGGGPKNEDPNGMERLTGETDAQYIARQTRLRDEAKSRMAAKFGGGGGMGGVGSGGGGRMGGIGSDPNYNPNGGYGGDLDVGAIGSSVVSGLGSAFGALSTAATSVTASGISLVQDEGTKRQLADMTSSVAATAGSFWGGLSTGASNLVNNITQPDDPGSDGLADLQRQFHSQAKPDSKYKGFGGGGESDGLSDLQSQWHSQANPNSKYSGFGSSSAMGSGAGGSMNGGGGMGSMAAATSMPTSTLGEAMPGPGEDPNGIERLSGESDEQYVMRQTRLRDEAKARMAAKFGGGGMGGVGSNGMGNGVGSAPRPAPSSGGLMGGFGSTSISAPTSANVSPARPMPKAPSSGNSVKSNNKVSSGDDFFANFGT